MKKIVVILLLQFLVSSFAYGHEQSVVSKQLWAGLKEAISNDVKVKGQKENQLKERCDSEAFQNAVQEVAGILGQKYSKNNVDNAIAKIEAIRQRVPMTEERKNLLAKYRVLISEYENNSKAFISVFQGEISNEDFSRYCERINELKYPKLQTMGKILKDHYSANGLDKVSFKEEYVYLNRKLKELRDALQKTGETTDRNKLQSMLESIVKIESEISEEHETYRTLK